MQIVSHWLMNRAVYFDGLTGEPTIKVDTIPVPMHPRQCMGCIWGIMGHIEHDGEWLCEQHYAEATTHPDAWQEYPTYGEYSEVWGD
jgi:hypothetical protein